MAQVELAARVRTESGKGAARQLRREGWIPAVVYGHDFPTTAVAVEAKAFSRVAPDGHLTGLLQLNIAGEGTPEANPTVVLKEVQRHPVSGAFFSIDFHRIVLTELLRVTVPLTLTGEPAGLRLGGILEHILHAVEVECLPTAIPDHMEVDVSGLGIGDNVHIGDLEVPEGVTVLLPREEVVAVLAPPAKVEEVVVPVAAVAAVEEEEKEPEVIGKGKPKEAEEEEEEEK